jgi:hypothetical protein
MTPEAVFDSVSELLARAGNKLPDYLGELHRRETAALLLAARSAEPQGNGQARVLTAGEAAALLNRSVSWVYKNKAALPVVRFPSGGWGIAEDKLGRWIERRTG